MKKIFISMIRLFLAGVVILIAVASPILPMKLDIYEMTLNSWSIVAWNKYMPYASCIVSTSNAIYVAVGHKYGGNSVRYNTDVGKLEF